MSHPTPPLAGRAREPHRPRRSLRSLVVLAGGLASLAAGTALAGPRLTLVDDCLEATAGLRLPSSALGGSIDAKLCQDCTPTRLTVERDTRFLVGKTAMPYPEWLAIASAAETPLLVCFRPDTRALTRLKVADPLAK
jgi:hypothetical protein